MPWISAAIAVGGSLVGGAMQGRAAERAADTTAQATREATALQRQQYEEGVQRQQPFYEAGVNALPGYLQGIQPGGELVRGFTAEDFQKYQDPGYGFRLKEGINALDRSAAARGSLRGGNQMRGITEFGQNLASQEYGNAYNRYIGEQATRRNALAGLVGQGQTTANTINASGAAMGTNVGNAMIGQGYNQANASMYGANAQARAFQNIGSIAQDLPWGSLFGSDANKAGSILGRQT
jgi:hypothetical protein